MGNNTPGNEGVYCQPLFDLRIINWGGFMRNDILTLTSTVKTWCYNYTSRRRLFRATNLDINARVMHSTVHVLSVANGITIRWWTYKISVSFVKGGLQSGNLHISVRKRLLRRGNEQKWLQWAQKHGNWTDVDDFKEVL